VPSVLLAPDLLVVEQDGLERGRPDIEAEPPGRRSIVASLPNQALSPSAVVSAAQTLAGG